MLWILTLKPEALNLRMVVSSVSMNGFKELHEPPNVIYKVRIFFWGEFVAVIRFSKG